MGINTRSTHWKLRSLRHAAEAKLKVEATNVIEHWNNNLEHDAPMLFSPTVKAALVSEYHWLKVYCGGCKTIAAVDLRVKRRPPAMCVSELTPSLICKSRCFGQAPLPRLVGLSRKPD